MSSPGRRGERESGAVEQEQAAPLEVGGRLRTGAGGSGARGESPTTRGERVRDRVSVSTGQHRRDKPTREAWKGRRNGTRWRRGRAGGASIFPTIPPSITGNSGAPRSRSGWSRCGRSRERRLTRSGSGPGRGPASLWCPRRGQSDRDIMNTCIQRTRGLLENR